MLAVVPETAPAAAVAFPATDQRPLCVAHANKHFAAEEEIYGEGEPAEWVFRVVSGAVRVFTVLDDGRRQIHAFHFPGDVFGLDNGADYSQSAEAICESQVEIGRRTVLDAASAQDCQTSRELWLLTAEALRRAREHLVMLGRKTARERVAGFLLEMQRRTGQQNIVDLPMSRIDIADYLGLTIETVSRTLNEFQRTGLIDLPRYRHVRLCNSRLLDAMAA